MNRKLYALLVLIGALGFLVLVYLYFFVYYTSNLTINANVWEYEVSLFSTKTAFKKQVSCPESICVISDLSPLSYSVSISKSGYESQNIPLELKARTSEELIVQLEKKLSLTQRDILSSQEESIQEKITRLREEGDWITRYELPNGNILSFQEDADQMVLYETVQETQKEIARFPISPEKQIQLSQIFSSDDILLSLPSGQYLLTDSARKLVDIDIALPIRYGKSQGNGVYIFVTEKGSFVWKAGIAPDYEVQFSDFVRDGEDIIGVIWKDDSQKRENFWIEGSWDVIVRYNESTKLRKELYNGPDSISKIYRDGQDIYVEIGAKEFKLENL